MTEKKKKSVVGKAVDPAILKRIFSYVRPYRTNFGMAVFTTLTLAGIAIIRPLLVKYTFDNYVEIPNSEMLLNMTLLMTGILFLEAFLQFSDAFLTNTLGQKIIKDLRSQVYRHIIGFRLKYYDNTPIGMLVTRAVSDIEVVADIFSEGLIVIIGDILKVLVIIAIMFMIDVELTIIVLLPIPALLISTYFFKKAVSNSFHEVRAQVARLNAFLQEHITGMRIVQIFNREKAEMRSFQEINAKHRDANIRSIKAYSIFFPVVEILSSIALALLVWWGGKGVLENYTSLGDLMAFIMFLNMMFRPIRQLADRFNTLQMGMVSSERVFKILDTVDVIENKGTHNANNIKGAVIFKDVYFAYNNEDWVLKNVSFEAKTGETIALVGATGAGKSSIINLLSRFYEYNKGCISIDGIDIRDYELSSLHRNIGVVLQDVFLFSDTIMNNITLNNPDITPEKVMEAAKVVGAHDFISNLPNGYNYDVMERGAMLSVGQRQLISFIRAYVYNSKILVLDEATSSIDTESERMIQYATEKLTQGRTSIVIAHRLATIQKADRIIVLDKGEVVESGNHQQLLKNNGHYKRLFELQFKDEVKATG
jgi:ATP-binding cassette subfamily B multidrug efflux pump